MTEKLQMKLCGDDALRVKCAPVDDASEIKKTLNTMVCMMDDQRGVGLAAPQVGLAQRFFVMREVKNKNDTGVVHCIINPEIVSKSENNCVIEEGCLSVLGPDDLPVFADVSRPEKITACWTDENGRVQTREFDGFAARTFQHEFDHLDGILFIDYLPPVKREMVMRRVRKRK
ncbi:MAG: peptide deformylase [Rickettsiales bacterium]|jgi:peptide deformylase|nr:peptide deformylase [Rickettsiales bacterium]